MFLAFKKYGMSEPYAQGEEVCKPWEMKLDPITVARNLKPQKLLSAAKLFPWLLMAVLLISDLGAFTSLFTKPFSEIVINWSQRSSDKYFDHFQVLRDCSLLAEEKSGKLKFLSSYFAIGKKDGIFARAIFNGRALSRLQKPPPPVNLPEIPTVLRIAARIHKYWQGKSLSIAAPSVYCADIRHYFHEFEIDPEIALYFGVSCKGKEYSWRGLPMGWAYSPRIAQCVSWSMVLNNAPECLHQEVSMASVSMHPPSFVHTRNKQGEITGIVFIWYDNIVVICYDNDHFRQTVANINANRKAWNITWSSEETFHPKALRQPDCKGAKFPSFLGVKIRVQFENRPRDGDPVSKLVWQCEDKLRAKVEDAICQIRSENTSRRKIARGIGLVIWCTYVYCIPLILIRNILNISRVNSPPNPGRDQWDLRSPISVDDLASLVNHLEKIKSDESWHQHQEEVFEPTQSIRIVSDSSSKKGGFVIFNHLGEVIDQDSWVWDSKAQPMCIFLKELLAATIALERSNHHVRNKPVHIAVDNTAAGFVIQRGLSTNAQANDMLARIYAVVPFQLIRVVYVRSADNAADPLTRNLPLNRSRNAASWARFNESEAGWPKFQVTPEFKAADGSDGESDSDWTVLRHREGDEDILEEIFDSEDESVHIDNASSGTNRSR